MKKKKIGIIGHFGGKEKLYDGQTIKTRILYDELSEVLHDKPSIADTYYKKSNPLKLVVDTVKVLIKADYIIILLSGNGMRVYFPLMYLAAKLGKKKVYHDVIGGNLADYCVKYPQYIKYLNSFVVNWVETENVKKKLEKKNICNVEVLPNFKRLSIIEKVNDNWTVPYKLCTFSRVMEEKGIGEAVKAVKMANEELGCRAFTLDIYGQIDENQNDWFKSLKKTFDETIRYCGIVNYDQSTKVLKNYFALLFPTLFFTEGVPGTIIDAYAAALPVISSHWEHFEDVVEDNKTGIGYEFGNTEALKQVLIHIYENPNRIMEMKKHCLDVAYKYTPENSMNIILKKMNCCEEML